MVARIQPFSFPLPHEGPKGKSSNAITLQSLQRSVEGKIGEFASNDQIAPQLENIQAHLAQLEQYPDYVAAHPELLDTIDAHLKMLPAGSPNDNESVMQVCTMILSASLANIIATQTIATQTIEIAHGKAKQVFVHEDKATATHVYFTPRETSGLMGKTEYARHEAELRREVEIQKVIRQRVGPSATEHLAVDAEETTKPEEKVQGKFTVKSEKADTDLEHALAENPSIIGDPFEAIDGLFQGLDGLHKAGVTHGDIKLDNVLVYKGQLRLADFGKAKFQKKGEDSFYTGNPRHEPPEGRQSKASDVYGIGFVAIQVVERTKVLGDRKSLIEVSQKDRKSVLPEEKRRGIERYAIEHNHCTQTETTKLRGTFRVMGRRAARAVTTASAAQLEEAQKATEAYINKLIEELKDQEPYKSDPKAIAALDDFGKLLKGMTAANPSERLTSEEIRMKYQSIKSRIPRVLPSGTR
jgi:hypothetical protein